MQACFNANRIVLVAEHPPARRLELTRAMAPGLDPIMAVSLWQKMLAAATLGEVRGDSWLRLSY
jgi:hypothetical protein